MSAPMTRRHVCATLINYEAVRVSVGHDIGKDINFTPYDKDDSELSSMHDRVVQ
ncbi:MAG: hypothetical protein ACI85N_001510 [Gammaproteobacteria bacterium]|jgi:hypothetical protein